jgi:hypothetical protein
VVGERCTEEGAVGLDLFASIACCHWYQIGSTIFIARFVLYCIRVHCMWSANSG